MRQRVSTPNVHNDNETETKQEIDNDISLDNMDSVSQQGEMNQF